MKGKVIFYENQVLWKQWIALIVFILLDILFMWGFIQQVLVGIPWGNNPMSDLALSLVTAFITILSFSLIFVRLETVINEDGIFMRYFPIHIKYKSFLWENITEAYVKNYDPIREYGGWGIRLHLSDIKVYNVYGNMGLLIELNNGNKVLIGTNKSEELSGILNKLDAKRKQK